MAATAEDVTLFGGPKTPWLAKDWTDSDDRVRGGSSQSYLDCSKDQARFHGTLDYDTLGGAGFASQRTTGDDRSWDLSAYAGIQLNIAKGDKKRYTFILKDELLKPDPDTGREQSTVSYECDFELPPQSEPGDAHDRSIFIPWKSLNATYRGKVKKDAEPLDTKSIKRVSIMMRSFFATQKGPFSLTIKSIKALKKVSSSNVSSEPTHSPASPEKATLFSKSTIDESRLEKGDINRPQRVSRHRYLPNSKVSLLVVAVLSFVASLSLTSWILQWSIDR